MKNEYDLIVQMHSTLLQLNEIPADPSVFGADFDEPDYSVEGFAPKLKKATSDGVQGSNQKKPRVKSAIGIMPGSESKKRASGRDNGIPPSIGPPVSKSI
tara:strand:- start:1164 stop:1463 length:300 start_codon:yes stop_codon:yes gene_type:complete